MIEREWEPEGYIDTDPEYFWKLMFHDGERAVLRPQRAGRVERETFDTLDSVWVIGSDHSFTTARTRAIAGREIWRADTRAQAARAARE